LLRFLAVEAPEAEAATIRAGRALLEVEPECYRVHDSLCRAGGVSHLHGATVAGPEVFTANLARRVGEMPGLPAPVARVVREEGAEPAVYAALRAAGADDPGEPSWAAVGDALQEVRFTHAWHRLVFMADIWSVDPTETADAFGRLLEGHRLRPLIDSFA